MLLDLKILSYRWKGTTTEEEDERQQQWGIIKHIKCAQEKRWKLLSRGIDVRGVNSCFVSEWEDELWFWRQIFVTFLVRNWRRFLFSIKYDTELLVEGQGWYFSEKADFWEEWTFNIEISGYGEVNWIYVSGSF